MSATPLEFSDTFAQWKEKINDLIGEFNEYAVDLGSFGLDLERSSGLNAYIIGGRVRSNQIVETLPSQNVALIPSTVQIIALRKERDQPANIQSFRESDLPRIGTIPLAVIETDASSIINAEDLRTSYLFAAGGGGGADSESGVFLINRHITEDVTIPEGQNGFSIRPTVDEGATVTVTEGSEWLVL